MRVASEARTSLPSPRPSRRVAWSLTRVVACACSLPIYRLRSRAQARVMLWSRRPLPRSYCASKYQQSLTRIILGLTSIPLPEPPLISRDSRILLKFWRPPQTDRRLVGKMPPKQATLGYVKSSQQTLGCDILLPSSIGFQALMIVKQVLRR